MAGFYSRAGLIISFAKTALSFAVASGPGDARLRIRINLSFHSPEFAALIEYQ